MNEKTGPIGEAEAGAEEITKTGGLTDGYGAG